MPGRDGNGIAAGGLDAVEGAHQIAVVQSRAILSLDKAESIAARRLRELAIRLGNDDGDAGTDRAPFDADRHFRERLAERMAALGGETSAAEPASGRALPYAVSDALPLSALGLSLPLLPRATQSVAGGARGNDPSNDIAQLPAVVSPDENISGGDAYPPDEAQDSDYPVFMPAVRLVDLINQQKTLVNRLADMSLAEEAAPQVGLDVMTLDSNAAEFSDLNVSATLARSDAEELFDVATHTAEPLPGDEREAGALVPLAISAEQLIAALESEPPPFQADEPVARESRLDELLDDRQPDPPVRSEHDDADDVERAPMIIERARAEMTAIANGDIALRPARPSGAVGFFAGLSLSIATGIALYYAL
jgi:hypothetical protein